MQLYTIWQGGVAHGLQQGFRQVCSKLMQHIIMLKVIAC